MTTREEQMFDPEERRNDPGGTDKTEIVEYRHNDETVPSLADEDEGEATTKKTTRSEQMFGKRKMDLNDKELKEYNRDAQRRSRENTKKGVDSLDAMKIACDSLGNAFDVMGKHTGRFMKIACNEAESNIQAANNTSLSLSTVPPASDALSEVDNDGIISPPPSKKRRRGEYVPPASKRQMMATPSKEDSENVPPTPAATPNYRSMATQSPNHRSYAANRRSAPSPHSANHGYPKTVTPRRRSKHGDIALSDHCMAQAYSRTVRDDQIEEAMKNGKNIGNNQKNPNTFKMLGKQVTVSVANDNHSLAVTTWHNNTSHERFAQPPVSPRIFRLPGESEGAMLSRIEHEVQEHARDGRGHYLKEKVEKELQDVEKELKDEREARELAEYELEQYLSYDHACHRRYVEGRSDTDDEEESYNYHQ